MRNLLFLTLLFCSSFSFGHEFFFAFAEVEFDELKGRFEASVTLTSHDLDQSLRSMEPNFKGLYKAESDSMSRNLVEREINRHFSIVIPTKNSVLDGANAIYFHLEGIEIELNGTIHLYLSAEHRTVPEKLEVTFDVLMDEFPEQQNKLTLIYRGKKSTNVFLPNQRTQLIELTQI
ncbi:MAG: DUF6702 family protein [Flavobacteriales bacterium]